MKKFASIIAVLLGLTTYTAARPATAAAQASCTVSCGCTSVSCGCSRVGGDGSACQAGSTGCEVNPCNVTRNIDFTPSGAAYEIKPIMPATFFVALTSNTAPALSIVPIHADLTNWELVKPGHSVARHPCTGVIIAERYDASRAADIRAQGRRLAL